MSEEISSLDPDWNIERLTKVVTERFHAGVLQVRCKEMAELFEIAGIPDKTIADRLNVSRPAVSQWFGKGRMKATHLAALLHHYHDVLAPLNEGGFRRLKERSVGGYIEAMFFVQTLIPGQKPCEKQLTRSEFAGVEYTFANTAWLNGNKELGAKQIVHAAEQEIGQSLTTGRPAIAWLEELMVQWGRPYLYTVQILSFM